MRSAPEPLISLSNLHIAHGQPEPSRWSLRIPSLKLERAALYMLVGENMCGKSTLLRVLAGQHDAGLPNCARDVVNAELKNTRVLLAAADDPMFRDWTVTDNVMVAAPELLRDRQKARREVSSLLSALNTQFGWSIVESSPLRSLSTGARAFVQLVRAQVVRPQLHLIDEITSNLDEAKSRYFIEAVCRLAADALTTVVIVSHSSRDQQLFVEVAQTKGIVCKKIMLCLCAGEETVCLKEE